VFFGTGRRWLAFLPPSLMAVALIPDLLPKPQLVFLELTSLRKLETFGGATFMAADGMRNPWNIVFYLGVFSLLVFVVDASISLWRRGARRRAALVGGTIICFVLVAGIHSALVDAGIAPTPYLFSFAYVAILAAMGMELSDDVMHAAQLARELAESQQRMTLAAEAVGLGVWIRDLGSDEMWASDQWRSLFGFAKQEPLELDGILQRVHPEDREPIRRTLASAVERGCSYETEYRVVLADGRVRWIASHGRVECNGGGKPALLRSVSLDITTRKQAEQELHERHGELTHLSRVSLVGELSGSLVHELGQPLGAIMANMEAAEMHLARANPNLDEVCAILGDVRSDTVRAGEVVRGMRAFLRRYELDFKQVDLRSLMSEVEKLVGPDVTRRHATVDFSVTTNLPPVWGHHVQLQQVLLNLILNGLEAMKGNSHVEQRLSVRAAARDGSERSFVEIAVSDTGPGLPPDKLEQVFAPFVTSKATGLGMGLSICRRIIEAHGGKIWIENNANCGATARFTLPIMSVGPS
jgi:PAS domain S-box-containing protein